MIGARLLFITWLTKNTFSKRTPFLLLYSLFTIPKNYLLPAKRKVSYMCGKLSMSVLYWIFSNHLHSYCIHCKRREMQQCHVFLNCCHVEKMTLEWNDAVWWQACQKAMTRWVGLGMASIVPRTTAQIIDKSGLCYSSAGPRMMDMMIFVIWNFWLFFRRCEYWIGA